MSTGRDDLERLRRFLLGDIAEAEREAIERQCLAEHSLIFDQLVALEDELRFDYLQGRLSPADHARFERRYAATPEGRSKLAFAQAVMLSADAAPASPSPRAQAKSWGSLVVLAGLGAAVVALAVVAGLQFSAARQLREDLAQAQAGSSKDSQALVNLQAEVTRTQAALTKAQTAATAASEELAKEQARRQDVELQLASFKRPLTTPVATPTPTPMAAAVRRADAQTGPAQRESGHREDRQPDRRQRTAALAHAAGRQRQLPDVRRGAAERRRPAHLDAGAPDAHRQDRGVHDSRRTPQARGLSGACSAAS